jgi:uncharacterized protein YigE (DUF2233 family)
MLRRALLGAVLGFALAGVAAADDGPCRKVRFEGDDFTVCAYDPARDSLRLASQSPSGPIGGFEGLRAFLGKEARHVAFAMNAGMYTTDQRPLGLWIERGKIQQRLNTRSGSGNFYLKPNGVFWTDAEGRPHLTETEAFAKRRPRARWATQSGPLLVLDGQINPHIQPNGVSLNVRNGVGVGGGTAFFVISDGSVSFGRFARFFLDGLGCPDALYFDGSVSSLWAPSLDREDRKTDLGTFVVVFSRR